MTSADFDSTDKWHKHKRRQQDILDVWYILASLLLIVGLISFPAIGDFLLKVSVK